jgi:hypothetical protein
VPRAWRLLLAAASWAAGIHALSELPWRARNRVAVDLQVAPLPIASTPSLDRATATLLINEHVSTEKVVLTSRGLCQAAIDQLGASEHGFALAGATNPQREVREACERVQAERVGDSLVLRLHFYDTDPERALAFADRLADLYIRRSNRSTNEQADWWQGMRSELETREASLVLSEIAVRDYLKITGGASRAEMQSRLDAELSAYNAALTDLRIRKARLEGRVAARGVGSDTKRSAVQSGDATLPVAQGDRRSAGPTAGEAEDGDSLPPDGVRIDRRSTREETIASSYAAASEDFRAQARALDVEERELLRRRDATMKDGLEMLGAGIEIGRLARAVQAREAERNASLRQLQQPWGAREAGEPARTLGPAYLRDDFAADAAGLALPCMLFLVGALILRRPRVPDSSATESHPNAEARADLNGHV